MISKDARRLAALATAMDPNLTRGSDRYDKVTGGTTPACGDAARSLPLERTAPASGSHESGALGADQWRPGMLVHFKHEGNPREWTIRLDCDGHGWPNLGKEAHQYVIEKEVDGERLHGFRLDLDDPATCGALLGLVRELWSTPWLSPAPMLTAGGLHGWSFPGLNLGVFPTEGALLMAAIEAAP